MDPTLKKAIMEHDKLDVSSAEMSEGEVCIKALLEIQIEWRTLDMESSM